MKKEIKENIESRDFIIRELKELMKLNPEYTFCEIVYSVLRMIPENERPKLTGLTEVSNDTFYKNIKVAIKEEEEIEYYNGGKNQ